MARTAIERLAGAIGYPDRVPEGSLMATLRVDGAEVSAAVTGDRLVLSQRLTDEADKLPTLAGFAAGRMLREDATLACDREGAFLWQETSETSDAHQLRRLFETFCDSCDWWRARLEPTADGGDVELSQNEMRILP